MADQASVRGPSSPGQRSPTGNGNGAGVVGSIADFGNDVATLAELQAKLAGLDLKECVAHATTPVLVASVGLVVVLGTVPVALLGVADLISRALGIAPGWGMLITAFLALTVAGIVLFLSVHEFVRSLEPMRRSREEFIRNLSWLRTVLVYSGRAYPKRGS